MISIKAISPVSFKGPSLSSPHKGPVWRLKKGMDRRFRSGHPWVYSNELLESPKGIEPGQLVELQDAGGKFIARGFGNSSSLISFREVTRVLEEVDPLSTAEVVRRLKRAEALRVRLGWSRGSYRLCYGEADGMPGLVIDRYELAQGQVFVIQCHSAGSNRLVPRFLEIFEQFTKESAHQVTWESTAIVVRNDLNVRKLEGLQEEEPVVLKAGPFSLDSEVPILVRSVTGGDLLTFDTHLLKGQKTGFFLDQFANIELAVLRFKHLAQGNPDKPSEPKTIRILDLFCYVGQWGAQLSQAFKAMGIQAEVLAVDSSTTALELAKRNIERAGGKCETLRADILAKLSQLESGSFDIVISDPPALIKSKKDVPIGIHAYLQMATQAIRLTRPNGGGVVCCSCSSLLDESELVAGLAKAAQRNLARMNWVGRGGQSPDHPISASFPEGRYLKGWIGIRGET